MATRGGKTTARRSGSRKTARQPNHKWIAGVKTVSTYPPEGLFTRDAATIARTLASKKVSPKGPASGLRMLLYFINRAGKGLSQDRRSELEKAKKLLSGRVHREKQQSQAK
jgi:tRNA(adenine34) deaminase